MDDPRTVLCLDCRTALAPGERCDVHPRGKWLDLADPTQRSRAVDAVWGPPHLRVSTAAKAGGVGGGAGGMVESCSGCDLGGVDGEAAVAILVIVAAAIVAVGLYYLVRWIVHAIRAWRARPRPIGVGWRPARARRVLRGTIRDAVSTSAPLSGTTCAAWGVVLEHGRAVGGSFTLRDGATAGLTLALDDGRRVTVPPGRVRVQGDGTRQDVTETYLRRIDPGWVEGDATPVIPCDGAREIRLAVGDVVEIVGGLEEQVDPTVEAGYRDAPPTRLVLAGVPTLVRAAG